VTRMDTLDRIATLYGVSQEAIKRVNPGKNMNVQILSSINIPILSSKSDSELEREEKKGVDVEELFQKDLIRVASFPRLPTPHVDTSSHSRRTMGDSSLVSSLSASHISSRSTRGNVKWIIDAARRSLEGMSVSVDGHFDKTEERELDVYRSSVDE
jgi:hypothetical protein